MILPPAIVRFRIVEQGRRKIGLWLPIFLLWPVLILLILVSMPLLLFLALAFWWYTGARKILRCILFALSLIFSLRGLAIEVEDEEDQVIIKIM